MMKSNSRQFGFTLLEVVVGVALIGFVIATAVLPQLGRARMTSKGAAQTVESAIVAARQKAIAQGTPVAFVVPSNGGSTPSSSYYYLVEGQTPRVSRVINLEDEQPGSNLFVGTWPVDTSKLDDPSAIPTTDPFKLHAYESDFDPASWPLPEPEDPALIFSPSGRLYTNGLTHFDGAVHVVVCQGADASSEEDGFTMNRVGSPYSIAVNQLGQVTLTTGLRAASSVVDVVDRVTLRANGAPPMVSSPGGPGPRISEVEIAPEPVRTGSFHLVGPTEPVLLTVAATGDGPLFATWAANGGTLSHTGKLAMILEGDKWVLNTSWHPPDGAATGDEFRLDLQVEDGKGQVAPRHSRSTINFRLGNNDPAGRYLFGDVLSGGYKLKSRNVDGTGTLTVLHIVDGRIRRNEYDRYEWSPDGTRFATLHRNRGVPTKAQFFLADGTPIGEIEAPPDHRIEGFEQLLWNPQGTRLAFDTVHLPSGERVLCVVDADGSNFTPVYRPYNPVSGGPSQESYYWSSDGQRLYFQSDGGVFGRRPVSTLIDGTDPVLFPTDLIVGPPSPDGAWMVTRVRNMTRQFGYTRADGTGGTVLFTPDQESRFIAWSKDSTELLERYYDPGRRAWATRWTNLDGTVARPLINNRVAVFSSNLKYFLTGLPGSIYGEDGRWLSSYNTITGADFP